jgi:Holliday junction resolvasome RuvABC endonuclease subunit
VIVGGLDVSLNGTGLARLDIQTGQARLRRVDPGTRRGHARIEYVITETTEFLRGVNVAMVEGYAYASRTPTAEIHEMTGLIKHNVLARRGVPYGICPPSNLKGYVTGNANAGKLDMLREMQRTFPALTIGSDDEADALALATVMCRNLKLFVDAHRLRYPHELDKMQWPDQDGYPTPRVRKKPTGLSKR